MAEGLRGEPVAPILQVSHQLLSRGEGGVSSSPRQLLGQLLGQPRPETVQGSEHILQGWRGSQRATPNLYCPWGAAAGAVLRCKPARGHGLQLTGRPC